MMAPNEDEIYVCRCEEVTVGDIKRAIKAGAHSIRDIKVRTNAGMGVCQGMTCRKTSSVCCGRQRSTLIRAVPISVSRYGF